jgi:crotonobetainyl-CoA:carnitine CoA-transferase CaiB-like acyl-CoA transferase
LVESVMSLQRSNLVTAAITGEAPSRTGSDAEYAAPNGTFKAADGHVAVAAYLPGRWEAFCQVLDRPDLIEDERFHDNEQRLANASALRAEIEAVLARRTVSDVVAALEAEDVPCAPVMDVAEAAASDHFQVRGRFQQLRLPGGREVDCPISSPALGPPEPSLTETPAGPGEHTREILAEWGWGKSETQALLASGAVESKAPPDRVPG